VKAQTLDQAVSFFDPRRPLAGQTLREWYIDRPGDPLKEIEIYLTTLGLTDQPAKLILTGHMGSGKSTTLNRLAEALKSRFFIVTLDMRQAASLADLSYVDIILGLANSLFKRATEQDVLAKAPAQIASGIWKQVYGFVKDAIFGPVPYREASGDLELTAKIQFLAVELEAKYAKEAITREQIRQRVEPRLAELHGWIDEIADQIRVKYERPVLFFVENTDKPDLARAREIFCGHTYALTAFRTSAIYTLPISLRYSAADYGLIRDHFTEALMLPNLVVRNIDGSPNEKGTDCLDRAIGLRTEDRLIDPQARRQIIEASGGLLRTLIRLVQRSAVVALGAGQKAIRPEDVKRTIESERSDFVAGLESRDYAVLRTRHEDHWLSADEDVLRLLDSRALLEYPNGEPWCDVHPIALPLVLERTSGGAASEV